MKRLLALLFVVLLLIWSWLLVKPQPVPESLLGGVAYFDREMLFFLLAKITHFSVYAFFAVLAGLIPRTKPPQLWLWGGLVLHGIASEVGQMVGAAHFDTKRHGCVRDVLIDAAGILAGAVLLRWWQNRA